MKKPIVITIAAVGGGGKTTAIELLNKQLGNTKALFFDDYDFEGPSDLVDWARRGGDYNEWKLTPFIRDVTMLLEEKESKPDYILLDYPFAKLNNEMNEFIDLTIFIDTPLDIAMSRRILRDYGHSSGDDIRKDMTAYLSGAREAYMMMIDKIKPNSDFVIDGALDKQVIVDQIKEIIIRKFT